MTFKDGSVYVVNEQGATEAAKTNIEQTLYVWDKGDKKPDPQPGGGETPVPNGTIFVEFTRDTTSIKEEGFENLKPLMYAANDTVPGDKFPAAKAADNYNQDTVTWTPAKTTVLKTTDAAYKEATKTFTFKASATQDNVPSVIYNPVEVIKGDSKTVTPSVNNIPNGSKYSIPDNFQVPNGVEIRINEDDGSVTIVTREDTPNQTFDVPVEVKDSNGSLITNSRVNISIVDKEIPENNDKEIGGWFKIIDGYKTEGNNNRKDEIGYAKAYIFGYPNKTVRPDNNLTRAEGVSMVARLQGYDLSDKSKPVFADTKADWYAGALNAAYKAGILEEKPGQNFRPNENMTRAELAQLISHIDKKNDAIAPFVDIKGHKFEAAINQCYGNKRILGYPDGTFKPDAYITRGEAATILNNFYNRKVRAEGLKNVVVTDFIDIVPSHWAYYEIIEASHNHEYRRLRENDIEELWLRIDR